ncbi:MAG: hypothetical protein A3E87_02220 [Gammaproteobacteria bacterium RIFCSPHIGHO2_12_FULL_35_23]|nr:MAG: hypothetical protein A3E87_02220 [Gammaproteobacteria bacterium RIFCSPHIGHO2_12_FULL_35_23]
MTSHTGTNQRVADAFFRGISKTKATSNHIILIGILIDYNLLIPADISGLFVLALTSWSSYNRDASRERLVAALLAADKPIRYQNSLV